MTRHFNTQAHTTRQGVMIPSVVRSAAFSVFARMPGAVYSSFTLGIWLLVERDLNAIFVLLCHAIPSLPFLSRVPS